MHTPTDGDARALEALHRRYGHGFDAAGVLAALRDEGLAVADTNGSEMVCRWVSTDYRAVPPEADTLIRTITTTLGEQRYSRSYWLEGLRGPRV